MRASIAASARVLVPPICRWTSSCRFGLLNAQPAWHVSRRARQRMPCRFLVPRKAVTPAERWRRRAIRTHDNSSDSRLHLLRPGCSCEGYGPLADELPREDLHGSRVSCKRGGTPWHETSRNCAISRHQIMQTHRRNELLVSRFSELFPPNRNSVPIARDCRLSST